MILTILRLTQIQLFDMIFHAEEIFERKVHMRRLHPLDLATDDVVLLEVKLTREDTSVGPSGVPWHQFASHFEVRSVSRLFGRPIAERELPEEHFLWGL